MAEQTPDSIITTQRNGQTIVAELFFNHSSSEILGHKNVSFTLNVYGSANLQQKVKCMNLLNDLL